MLNILLAMTAISAAQAVTPAAPAAAPARTLQNLPGITITYYNVTGKDGNAIRKSIAKQRPKAPNGEPIAATTNWKLDGGIKKRTENGQCQVVDATLTLAATAELPKLTTEASIAPDLLKGWRDYVAGLENTAAAELWAVHDHLPEVKQAIMAGSCDNAGAAMTAASDKLKEYQKAAREAALAKLKANKTEERDRTAPQGLPEEY